MERLLDLDPQLLLGNPLSHLASPVETVGGEDEERVLPWLLEGSNPALGIFLDPAIRFAEDDDRRTIEEGRRSQVVEELGQLLPGGGAVAANTADLLLFRWSFGNMSEDLTDRFPAQEILAADDGHQRRKG